MRWDRRVDAWVGPYKWLIIYVLALLVFASVYAFCIPADFHSPTARYEPAAQAELRSLERDIESYASGQMSRGARWDADTEWMSETSAVTDLQIGSDTMSFRYTASRRMRPRGKQEYVVEVVVPLTTTPDWTGKPPDGMVFRQAEIRGATCTFERDDVFTERRLPRDASRWLGPPSDPQHAGWLAIPPPSGAALEWYSRTGGISSDPADVFWRMLYLSATTITTLGYGDIVPISTAARLLVGLEAVLGVCLIGVFLAQVVGGLQRPETENRRTRR